MTRWNLSANDVIRIISPDDEMGPSKWGEPGYHSVGQSALQCIRHSLEAAGKDPAEVRSILDLPCGHGRVLRYLKAAFPDAAITACDLSRDGVDFCAATFGARPVYSVDDPARIPLEREAFDLIWVGSLFTHFDAERWPGFLNALRSFLRPRGVLVFTTHGRAAWHLLTTSSDFEWGVPYYRITSLLHDYRRTGFGYGRYPWSNTYGVSLSTADWVLRRLEAIDELRLVYCSERAWSNFHDVFAMIREPDWHVRQPPIPTWRLIRHKMREVLKPGSRGWR
jgi:SAM-dependent methyltransferase